MNETAKGVMREVQDVVIAYGQSDEYRWVESMSSSYETAFRARSLRKYEPSGLTLEYDEAS